MSALIDVFMEKLHFLGTIGRRKDDLFGQSLDENGNGGIRENQPELVIFVYTLILRLLKKKKKKLRNISENS